MMTYTHRHDERRSLPRLRERAFHDPRLTPELKVGVSHWIPRVTWMEDEPGTTVRTLALRQGVEVSI